MSNTPVILATTSSIPLANDEGDVWRWEQAARAQKLFAAVVLAALNDAIDEDKKHGSGAEVIAHWARSRHGQEVLILAGINPSERTIAGMVAFVKKGKRTSMALSKN